MHGGTVDVSSEGPDMGSEFIVRLPALSLEPPPLARKAEKLAGDPSHSRTILVVDDNRDLADSLGMFLRDAGHQVFVAYNGEEGLACAGREHPSAVLLDLGLPGMDGYAVAEKIRAQPALKNTTVIAISGYKPLDDERTRSARFDAHLVKPIAYGQLLSVLQQKLSARRDTEISLRAHRILLIEDNRELALLTAELLRDHGQEVDVALTGEAGIVKDAEFRPEVVFCDLNLPGTNGFETARILRQKRGAEPLLLVGLTGEQVEVYQSILAQTPFDLFLSKPLAWSKVRETLARFDQESPAAGQSNS
jgi:CheY-like chemotaxis protein